MGPATYMRRDVGVNMVRGLQRLMRELPAGLVMAEIGVFAGESTRLMVESGRVRRVYAVDPWGGDYVDDGEVWRCPFEWAEVRETFETWARGQSRAEVVVLGMRSVEAAALVECGSLDFVYVDGAHSFEAVVEDVGTWLPRVRPGGWMGGHDWGRQYPGVERAVRGVLRVWGDEVQVYEDTSWLVRVR